MHCEPERWDVLERPRAEASQPLTPELIEAHLRRARLLRSQAVADSFRALFKAFRRRRPARARPRTLYARLATWNS
jgi:hypothetical protein